MSYITPQELIDAGVDAGTLERFATGSAGEPNINRKGNDVENLETLRSRALEIAREAANMQTYLTKSEMESAGPQPRGTMAQVTNDVNPNNNGYWVSDGVQWLWSGVQLEEAQKTLTLLLGAGAVGTQEFFNDDQLFPAYFAVDSSGNVVADLLRVDEDGPLLEFHNDDSVGLSQLIVGAAGEVLAGWDDSGNAQVAGLHVGESEAADQTLLPYVAGNELRAVGQTDQFCAGVAGVAVRDVYAASSKHVRAVIGRPSLGASTAVAAAPNRNVLMPDSDSVLHVIIGVGQSLMVGANSEGTLVSVTPVYPEDVLMFDSIVYSDIRMGANDPSGTPAAPLDPATLVDFTPLIAKAVISGPRGETLIETMANSLSAVANDIGSRFQSLSFIAGVGGTSYAGLKKGNQIYTNMLLALERARGLAAARGLSIIVDAVVCKHGESGVGDPAYKSYLQEWRSDIDADVKAITGQLADVHFIFSQLSSFSTSTPESVLAMLELHNEDERFHLACPDYCVGAAGYHVDYLHMIGPGYAHLGAYYAQAWMQSLWSASGRNKVLQMASATRDDKVVTVLFDVPVVPLQIDTVTVAAVQNFGFRFYDSTGDIPIELASLAGDGVSVVLQLARVPSGIGERVEYALTPQSNPRSSAAIPRGNLCDSSAATSIHNDRPLKNWAVHQRISL